jgi:hypothetical protein
LKGIWGIKTALKNRCHCDYLLWIMNHCEPKSFLWPMKWNEVKWNQYFWYGMKVHFDLLRVVWNLFENEVRWLWSMPFKYSASHVWCLIWSKRSRFIGYFLYCTSTHIFYILILVHTRR